MITWVVACTICKETWNHPAGQSESLLYVPCPKCGSVGNVINSIFGCDGPGCKESAIQAPRNWYQLSVKEEEERWKRLSFSLANATEGGDKWVQVAVWNLFFHSAICLSNWLELWVTDLRKPNEKEKNHQTEKTQ
jgi:hypothetical protein